MCARPFGRCHNRAVIDAAVRASSVPPFHAMVMGRAAAELAASGQRVLHLEVGQPSTPLPRLAATAVRNALDEPLGYTNAGGMPALRRRLAERYDDGITPDRVIIVAGASAGFTMAFLSLFEPGSRVGIIEPGYPCYRNVLVALGMIPVAIPVGPDTRWAPTREHLDRAGTLNGIVISSPANPTGTVYDDATLAMIAEHCRVNGVAIVADEIYHGIVNGPPAPSIRRHEPDAVVVNSFSKYWSMTGWRVGWILVPDRFVELVERLHQNVYICAPHVSQVAALAALDATDEIDGHVARYRTNRQVLIDGLAGAGITDIAPADGAFYVYAHVPHLTATLGIDSLALCYRWLRELGVAATSGVDFDLQRGHDYVRFSYAGLTADITEACELLAGWAP
jgi:aspartate/methionine/tyrosine aminotransferase